MTVATTQLIQSLLAAVETDAYASVLALPGAGIHAKVLHFSDALRGAFLEEVGRLPLADRISFTKALAVYENTVGGLGSVTALVRVLPLIDDQDHAVLDWILSKTKSYSYCSHGAKSFAQLREMQRAHADRRARNEEREREREVVARRRRAERATANLFNAVRRGDIRAVLALLRHGALATGTTPDGVPLAQYAESCGRSDIAVLLRGGGRDDASNSNVGP